MGARIGADETIHPVGRRTVSVVALERRGVVWRLVAEGLAKRADPALVLDQPVPVEIMPDLMAKVADEGAVGLVHGLASRLALRVVGLGDVDRDEPVVVPREHRLDASVRPRLVGDQVEGEAPLSGPASGPDGAAASASARGSRSVWRARSCPSVRRSPESRGRAPDGCAGRTSQKAEVSVSGSIQLQTLSSALAQNR